MCCYYVDLEQKGATTGSKWFNRKEAEKKEVRRRTRSQKTFHFTRASHTKTMRNECGLIGEAGEGRDRVISYVSWVKDGTKIFIAWFYLFIYFSRSSSSAFSIMTTLPDVVCVEAFT